MTPPTFIHGLNYIHTPFYNSKVYHGGCVHRDTHLCKHNLHLYICTCPSLNPSNLYVIDYSMQIWGVCVCPYNTIHTHAHTL